MGDLISAFSVEQTVRLTGVSKTQLRYWDQEGFFSPSEFNTVWGKQYGRVYSFRDLVSLKILNDLRNVAGVPLGQLKKLKIKWNSMGDDIWTSQKLFAENKRVIVISPDGPVDALSGQGVLRISVEAEYEEMKEKVSKYFRRNKKDIGKISKARQVASNKPVISGTRIPVKTIQAFAARGYSIKEIIKEYPSLRKKDVQAAIKYKETA